MLWRMDINMVMKDRAGKMNIYPFERLVQAGDVLVLYGRPMRTFPIQDSISSYAKRHRFKYKTKSDNIKAEVWIWRLS